jgi:Mn-containing catalase
MRTVAANEHIQQRIRFLIQRQHDHERQWWKGREALLQKQKSRVEKKRELDEVLYALSPYHSFIVQNL